MNLLISFGIGVIMATAPVIKEKTNQDEDSIHQKLNELAQNRLTLSADESLERLFLLHWNYLMEVYPEWATYVGISTYNDRWTDLSRKAIEGRKTELKAVSAVFQTIPFSEISEKNKINYKIFQYDMNLQLRGLEFPEEYFLMNQLSGIQTRAAELIMMMPKFRFKDYQNILARMKHLPRHILQMKSLLEEGLQKGMTPPRVTLQKIPEQIQAQMIDVSRNPWIMPFQNFPGTISLFEQKQLRNEAEKIFREGLIPAWEGLYEFMVKDYLPRSRKTTAWNNLPQGSEWYVYYAAQQTTTTLSPTEIHQMGLQEVERIRGEMKKIMHTTGFQGSDEEFLNFLRTDKRFFYENKEDLIRDYRALCKKVDPELVKLFKILPRMPYGVEPIPEYAEKASPAAYYWGGSWEVGRPGYFRANTYDLLSRPKWEMEALVLHEAVPGHHLQISLAQEQEGVPEFRKHGGFTAYVEGWALYAESLGKELGFYQDPYSNFGRLTAEMWRAIRLVVDTGMHALGWSREQAIDYFRTHAGRADHDIQVEVDRYLVWPGQALAYKIGELKIKELRDRAQKELGEKFDIREFHNQLLKQGALPLSLLEEEVDQWIQSMQK